MPGDLATFGKPGTCVGGGDSALAIDSLNRLYFGDLQGLTNVSNSVSSDQGATFLTTCNAANAVGVDRPWIAAFGDPQNGGALYQTVDQTGQCIGACEPDLGQVGANMLEITRSQDGVTFTPLPMPARRPRSSMARLQPLYESRQVMTYPPAHTIAGAFTPLGGITLDVPVADVGGNSKSSLVSITGLTVTQATPSSTGDTIFNQVDATRPFDFKP